MWLYNSLRHVNTGEKFAMELYRVIRMLKNLWNLSILKIYNKMYIASFIIGSLYETLFPLQPTFSKHNPVDI